MLIESESPCFNEPQWIAMNRENLDRMAMELDKVAASQAVLL
jgi:hypothetical protein